MRKILILLIVFSFTVVSFAGDAARRGTSGADQLLIPVGARSIATAGAFLANTHGVEAIYYNPAGLGSMTGTEAMFDYSKYIADINISYLAVGTNLGDIGSIALSYKSIGFGDIPITTYDNPDGTGETYSPSYVTLGITYSKELTDRVIAGVTMKAIHEGIQNTTANGWALDFGVQYNFNKQLSLGVVVANIGDNMKYTGADLQQRTLIPGSALGSGTGVYTPITEEFEIPSYFDLSTTYKFMFDANNSLSLAAAFRNNNNLDDIVRGGIEYDFMNMLYLRGGYNYYTGNQDNYIYDYALGAGVYWEMVDGVKIKFDYAFRHVKENALGSSNVFTLTLGLD